MKKWRSLHVCLQTRSRWYIVLIISSWTLLRLVALYASSHHISSSNFQSLAFSPDWFLAQIMRRNVEALAIINLWLKPHRTTLLNGCTLIFHSGITSKFSLPVAQWKWVWICIHTLTLRQLPTPLVYAIRMLPHTLRSVCTVFPLWRSWLNESEFASEISEKFSLFLLPKLCARHLLRPCDNLLSQVSCYQ